MIYDLCVDNKSQIINHKSLYLIFNVTIVITARDDTDQPKPDHDLRFGHHVKRFLYQSLYSRITGLLEMVMKGSHLENAPSLTVFLLRIFEIERLHKDGEILHQEDAAQDRDQ